MSERDPYMSVKTAAEYTDFSEDFLRARLHNIPHLRVGTDIRIRQSVIDAWMESHLAARQLTAREIVDQISEEMGL